jgi:phosphatidate cytidylyltransferase
MHLKRWISGLVLAPLLILFTLSAPPLLFSLLILALVFIGLREFSALALPDLPSLDRAAGILAGLLAPLACSFPGSGLFSAVLAGLILFLFIRALSSPDPFGARVDRTGRQLLGFLYVPFLLSHFVLLRSLPAGELWVLFVLTAVFSGDTAAFYVGRARGRTKLAPAISPGKTVEGAWGAAAGAAAGALLFKF